MSIHLDKELVMVGYFLSRMGVDHPPEVLSAASWKEAYLKFYSSFGSGKTELEFRNSLKNIRDHFDSHLANNRIGWLDDDGEPQQLSGQNKEVFFELSPLTDVELWKNVKGYAVQNFQLKNSEKSSKILSKKQAKFFSSEFSGKKSMPASEEKVYESRHGAVIDSLLSYIKDLSEFKKGNIYNTKKMDLAFDLKGMLKCVWEVKTSTDTQSIYTAVGQLYMHTALAGKIKKWIVIPGPIQNDELIECLSALHVEILWYKWIEEECVFTSNNAN